MKPWNPCFVYKLHILHHDILSFRIFVQVFQIEWTQDETIIYWFTNLSNFNNQLPNRTISVLFLFGKKPHPKTKYVIVSYDHTNHYFLSTHAIENWTETQIMGTLGMIHKSGATFSNDFSKFVLGWHEEYSSSVVSNCPPQAQAGNWQLYIHTTSIYYQISQWVQILSEVKVCKLYCLSFPFIFHIETFFCRLNNVKNKIERQTIE